MKNTKISLINSRNKSELSEDFLDSFERHQETTRIYFLDENGELKEKAERYVDDWDLKKKKQVIEILSYYIDLGGSLVFISNENALLGFAALNGKAMGTRGQYLNLGFIHVSKAFRGKGLGKILFQEICQQAREKGAEKLYVGANPNVKTYQFYKSMGCSLAKEIIKEVYDHEPLDLQLEYDLSLSSYGITLHHKSSGT